MVCQFQSFIGNSKIGISKRNQNGANNATAKKFQV